LKAGARSNIDNAALASGSHCFAEEVRESDQRLYIHFNFGLLLLGIVGQKCTAQAESRVVDEKIDFNAATFKLFRDCL
jgi:hypothetical protein